MFIQRFVTGKIGPELMNNLTDSQCHLILSLRVICNRSKSQLEHECIVCGVGREVAHSEAGGYKRSVRLRLSLHGTSDRSCTMKTNYTGRQWVGLSYLINVKCQSVVMLILFLTPLTSRVALVL